MALETQKYQGALTTVITMSADVADGEVVGGTVEFDNSSLLYKRARLTLAIPSSFSAAPTGQIICYMVRGELDAATTLDGTALGYAALTTSDDQTDVDGAEFVGAWNPIADQALVDAITIDIDGVKKGKIYVLNDTGVIFTTTADATVKMEMLTSEIA